MGLNFKTFMELKLQKTFNNPHLQQIFISVFFLIANLHLTESQPGQQHGILKAIANHTLAIMHWIRRYNL